MVALRVWNQVNFNSLCFKDMFWIFQSRGLFFLCLYVDDFLSNVCNFANLFRQIQWELVPWLGNNGHILSLNIYTFIKHEHIIQNIYLELVAKVNKKMKRMNQKDYPKNTPQNNNQNSMIFIHDNRKEKIGRWQIAISPILK